MAAERFFEQMSEASRVKARIVSKYFAAWANVIASKVKNRERRMAYVDLFCGPGRYKDGTPSTPLLVLEQVLGRPDLRDMLITRFNDADTGFTGQLRHEIAGLQGVDGLAYAPEVTEHEVGEQIAGLFGDLTRTPTLFFVDPWGYKGLSLELVYSMIGGWGCDCILFFNHNRVNMHLSNAAHQQGMAAIFGPARARALTQRLEGLPPEEREAAVLAELCATLGEVGARFFQPFAFMDAHGSRTSHYLVGITKNFTGYDIMKGIMARESQDMGTAVSSFAFNPADPGQQMLFDMTRPLEDLGDMLLATYADRTVTLDELYREHSVGKPYTKPNYRAVLLGLESEGKIAASPSQQERRAGTFAGKTRIRFP